MWETYFCVRFDSRNGRIKPLQSFWYTLYVCKIMYLCMYEWTYVEMLQTRNKA